MKHSYLIEHSVLATRVQRRVVSVLHRQTSVDVKSGHEVWFTGLRVLEALGDEGRSALGQQQELLYALEGAKNVNFGKKQSFNCESWISSVPVTNMSALGR